MNIKIIRLLLFPLFFFIAAFMPGSFAFAQTAADVDNILQAETVTAAAAARFVLAAAELLPDGISGADAEKAAYDLASSNGWIKTAAEESLSMKDSAFLIMKAFDMKGGLMYSLFKNPRYAYRELMYQNIITGRINGKAKVIGASFLQILDRTINK